MQNMCRQENTDFFDWRKKERKKERKWFEII
jgi:hypothetical protein